MSQPTELDKLKCERKILRCSVTKVINSILDISINPGKSDETKCEELQGQLISKSEQLFKLDEDVKGLITNLDLLEKEIEKCLEYRDNITSAKCKIDRVITNKQKNENIKDSISPPELSVSPKVKESVDITYVKLPKLTIEPFDGSYENWQEFWGQFQGAIHGNTQLSKIDKFQYLKGFLKGSALNCIQGLSLTDDNYDLAIELLKERFGKDELIIRTHVNKLLCLNPVKSSSNLIQLRELHDTCTIHIRNLQAAGVEPNNYGGILYAILVKLIPEEIILNYNRNTNEKESWSCDKLLEFLKNEIKTREKTLLLRKTDENARYKTTELQLRKNDNFRATASSRDTYCKSGSKPSRIFYDRSKAHHSNVGKEKLSTAAALTSTIKASCIFCSQSDHDSENCQNLNLDDKRTLLKKQGRCWRCLKKFHLASNCKVKLNACEICKSTRHMKVMCNSNSKESCSEENLNETQTVVSSLTHDKYLSPRQKVILQTCRVIASSRFKSKIQFCLLDSASEKTFITESLAKELELKPIRYENLQVCAFGSREPVEKEYEVVRLKLRNCDNPKCYVRVEALVTDIISAASLRFCKQNKVPKPAIGVKEFELFDINSNDLSILIGMDYYYIVNKGNVQRISRNLYTCKTLFGPTIQGQVSDMESSPNVHVMKISAKSVEEAPWRDIRCLWKLEALGLLNEGNKDDLDSPILKDFEDNIKFVNGRYEPKLIWNVDNISLRNNFDVAKKRFVYLANRLKNDKWLLNNYTEIMEEQLKTGIIEECSRSENEYFMPHRPVIREDKSTTKVRVVYDASSKAKDAFSLNDCLLSGPNLNPNILNVILKFREFKIAFNGDIEKAFHQISVAPEDREFLKFLWFNENDNEHWKILRMTRVPFGATCSPFILGATIKHHLRKYESINAETCDMLNEALYVDDLYSGCDTEEHALKLSVEAVNIFKDAGMNLRKFTTNSPQLRDLWCRYEIPQNETDSENSMKVLGIKWNPFEDVLSIELQSILERLNVIKFTKRFVLQIAATLFDPVGFVTPFTIQIKCIIQEIWTLGLDWDDELPFEIREKFLNWCDEITHLQNFCIDRHYFSEPVTEKSIHIFSDASPRAYGAVAYFRYVTDNDSIETSFIMSKARVSPLKKLTLPRLELMAAVIAARLANYLKSLFKIPIEEITLWTDSSITYYWIKGSALEWKPFVSNRVREIQEHTNPQNWNHVKSKFNPADLITRGEKAKSFIDNNFWWHGPEWLRYQEDYWPRTEKIKDDCITTEIDSEYNSTVIVHSTVIHRKIIDPEKFSCLSRLLRVTAWVLRFIDTLKRVKVQKGPLTSEELEDAEKFCVKDAQKGSFLSEITCLENHKPLPKDSKLLCFNPHLDQENILRVTGRLGKTRLLINEKNPIILSPKSKLVELIIRDSHERVFHSGVSHTLVQVREKYWILRARQAVKSLLGKCVICKRFNSSPGDQTVAPLPADRVEQAAPFSVIGLDFAGPLFVKDNESKQYILLITCAVTRSLHLELVGSLSTDTFLLAFRRFIARRGLCSIVYSDNARTFKRAEQELKQIWSVINHPEAKRFYAVNGIKWKYIVERAAWWGGFYERMVRTVKVALRKALGKSSLNTDQLQTVLTEIEGMVNSRPISYIGADPNEPSALTPAHFIVGKRLSSLPSIEEGNYTKNLTHFCLLGRLFQIYPYLVTQGECTEFKFLHLLANGLNYPSDDVKSVILFLLSQIYQNAEKKSRASRSMDAVFIKNILRILKKSQNKMVLKGALGLLKLFITKVLEIFDILFETSGEDISFTDVIKKLILSQQQDFQVCAIQCMCHLLSNPTFEKQIPLLLKACIPEILFDILSVKNELLLESILCCLNQFVHGAANVTKSHLVFGVEIIIDISYSLLESTNWRLLSLALNLVTSIISSNESLMTSSHITFFCQAIQLTEKAFKVQNPTILLLVCKFFKEFLKNKNLPWFVPLEEIHNNMNLCLKALSIFISSVTAFEQFTIPSEDPKSLPLEIEILICSLDILSSCISLCKNYALNPVSVESGFSCPKVVDKKDSSEPKEISTQPLLLLCLSAADEFFIPCCLQLKHTNIGRVPWYHLVQVLIMIYEEFQDNVLIYKLSKKLISVGIFKYVFDLKVSKAPFNEGAEQVKNACNQCVNMLLRVSLKNESYPEMYKTALENGVISLNDSFEESVSVLSQKSNKDNIGSADICASSQIAFLCLCYVSYMNEEFVVNIKILIPHLIYFVICNSNLLSSCTVLFKHVIFLMAICTYECSSKKLKFLTGLMEANMIIWDILQKLKSPLQVYTHHKYVLWWCFKNEACNPFSSFVLLTWLKYCADEKHTLRHYAMKTVIYLLLDNHTAQQAFVFLFDNASPSNNDVLVSFLKEAHELEGFSDTNKKKFQDLTILMIHHLNSVLVKLYIMKNENDKSVDKIICQGLDCLLWCLRHIDDITVDVKLLFYVSKCCFLTTCKEVETLTACIKFLTFTLNHPKHFKNAWHVMTGDINFPSFFYKCFASTTELGIEVLYLLVSLFCCQLNYTLKCNIQVQVKPNLILKWLSSARTQNVAYQLLNLLIKSEFQDNYIVFTPLGDEAISSENQQYLYYRLFYLYLVNALILENPVFQEAAVGFLKFLNFVGKTDKYLEEHIMLQPWIKFLLESRLEKLDYATWNLFEKWLSLNKMNPSLTGVMEQFAIKVKDVTTLTCDQRRCIYKLYTGTYGSCLSKETRNALKQLSIEKTGVNEREKDLVSQVQNLITDYLSTEAQQQKEC